MLYKKGWPKTKRMDPHAKAARSNMRAFIALKSQEHQRSLPIPDFEFWADSAVWIDGEDWKDG